MCTDFTSLNKVFPKDFNPVTMPGAIGGWQRRHEIFNFMDDSRGYQQIKMIPEDEEKTAFMTEYDLYCWKVMPFGLKNAGATY
ncbi:hypothetical protein LIER_14862 [Lithospermum erythrorhizon]|uniref:Reverse transcriptase domain-containing protein n=1 Tax=Lithospermum erythrorhizon TaxID=34254 RepID=A0AAV3Q0R7_LITER